MDNKDKNKNMPAKDIALAGSSLGAIGASKNMILGKKRMYHGTSLENWDKIKHNGLKADMGGINGASDAIKNLSYIDKSKDNVHLTRFKPYARTYAGLHNSDVVNQRKKLSDFEDMFMDIKAKKNGMSYSIKEEFRKNEKELFDKWRAHKGNADKKQLDSFVKSLLGAPTPNGKVMKINMDYDKFKEMSRDTDGGPFKNMAAKGNIDVSPEEIFESSAKIKDRVKHTAKNLPGYIKNNPKRFGGGLALAGAGAYGLKKLYDKNNEKQANQVHHELQIEKYALNAQKARAMAKEVGIMPQGAWKFALRNSRNMKTGDLLKGKELAEAHAKLGKLPNNAYQAIKSKARKLPSNTEIGGLLDKNRNIVSTNQGPIGMGGVPFLHEGKRLNFHTHPGFAGQNRTIPKIYPSAENIARFSSKNRNALHADLSGKISAQGGKVNFNKQQINNMLDRVNMDKVNNLKDEYNKVRSLQYKLPMHAPIQNEVITSNVRDIPLAFNKKHDKSWDNYRALSDKHHALSNARHSAANYYRKSKNELYKDSPYYDGLGDIKGRAYDRFVSKKEEQIKKLSDLKEKAYEVSRNEPSFLDFNTPETKAKKIMRRDRAQYIDSLDANKQKIRDRLSDRADRVKKTIDSHQKDIVAFSDREGGDFGNGLRGVDINHANPKSPKATPHYKEKYHNVISPDQDIEGAHKLGDISVDGIRIPNQRARSVFFDRSPRKSR